MKIIYFSLDYTPHDHRFLTALAETEHQVYYVRLQRGPRQTEDRPVPEKIEQISYCEMTEEQRAIYQQLLEAGRREVLDAVGANGLPKSRMVVLTTLLRLRPLPAPEWPA